MAEAYGKLTGRPGVCIVTRGPGATHASVGVHTAFQDSTPMILLVGQVSSVQEEREAFQEIDYRRMFGPLAKWVAQIDRVDRIPELIARAYTTACAGRPGPVVLALPEDMLAAASDAADAPPFQRIQPQPGGVGSRVAARAARAGRAAVRDHRRRRLDAGAPRPTCRRFLEANALAGGRGVPPAGRDRQRLAELRRRRRHRHQPGARRTGARRRPAARRRAAARRDDDLRLHAARRAATAADARARASRRRGARPRLPGRPADPLGHGAVRRGGPRPARRAALGGLDGAGAGRLRGVAAARADARAGRPRRLPRAPARRASRTRSSPTAPATSRSGCTASGASTTTRASSRRRAARWATACRPRSPRRACCRTAT